MTLPIENSVNSLRQFRKRIARRMAYQQRQKQPRHQVIFAVDGIYAELAQCCWRYAHQESWQAVFPSTSASCWLSSLTGQSIEQHGVPGVVFRPDPAQATLINICDYQGDAITPPTANLFTDCYRYGFTPQAIAGDLLPIQGSWTRALLTGVAHVDHHAFYTDQPLVPPAQMIARLEGAVGQRLNGAAPTLLWCFIDVDQYVHLHGYDDRVEAFLCGLESLAERLVAQGCDVIAYADHGLVPTQHDPDIARSIERICGEFGATMGGAGRTRWFYVEQEHEAAMQQRLARAIGDIALVMPRTSLFSTSGSSRMGNLLLIAQQNRFISPPSYRYEHGSLQAQEMSVPYAVWEDL
ncbi:hypothetical protein L580_4323 [Serratia fonticola AU-P3(3)]|nr:hypothetical protein L580_4323 [Serratia fonticola AU-P3(3)]